VKRKRGNGDGSVYEKSPGRYCAQFSYRRDGRLKRKTKYFATKTNAKRWLSNQGEARDNHTLATGPKTNFGSFAAAWLADRKLEVRLGRPVGTLPPTSKKRSTKSLSPGTWRGYEQFVKMVDPYSGKARLDSISGSQLDTVFKQLLVSHAAITIKLTRVLLSQIFKAARRQRLIASNPVEDSKPIQVQEYDARVLDEEEALRFVEASIGERLEAFFRVGVAIGQRMGEGLGSAGRTWLETR
jgi:integrase